MSTLTRRMVIIALAGAAFGLSLSAVVRSNPVRIVNTGIASDTSCVFSTSPLCARSS